MRAWILMPLFIACGPPAPDLESIKREIREEFPDVRGITTEELARWLTPPPVLLDVRAPDEYEVSHLRGARRALTEAEAVDALRGARKDERIVVYCSVGLRSARLARALQARGFTNVYNLEGSIFQWANEGRPVYRDGREVQRVHPYDEHWGALLDARLR